MKTKITALAISVIMMCSMMSSCGKKEIQMHTYEAIVNGEAFKLTYPVASDGRNRCGGSKRRCRCPFYVF